MLKHPATAYDNPFDSEHVEVLYDMACDAIKLKDGSTVLVNVRPGCTLTLQDKQVIAEYVSHHVEFCRNRKAAKQARQPVKSSEQRLSRE